MPKSLPKRSASLNSQPDKLLWGACQQGDRVAFEQLYNLYFDKLVSYGRRLTADQLLIEDAIQDVFIDIWRRKAHLAEIESLKYYLFKALRNQLTRNTRHDVFEGAEDIDDFLDLLVTLSAEHQSIEQETATNQIYSIRRAIDRLSKRQQEAIHLRFYQGLSLDEMTHIMALNKQSVSNLLFKAYAVLRASIKSIPLAAWGILQHGL